MEVIAELGINHNGSLSIAQQMIDIAASAGCDYVKFQKRSINLVYDKEELRKPRESPWGSTTRQQKQGIELGYAEYHKIHTYCHSKGIKWFASPWDKKSLVFITSFNPPFIKIPSALVTDKDFLLECRKIQEIPFILSTGMCDWEIIDNAIEILERKNIYCIMHCTSTYPTAPDDVNMRTLPAMQKRYPWTKIGFSNHYPGLMALQMAATLGAEMLEFHFTLDRTMYGSDQAASIEPQGMFELMTRLKLIGQMRGTSTKEILISEVPIMAKLRKNNGQIRNEIGQ